MILKYYNGTEYVELAIIEDFSISNSIRELKYSSVQVIFEGYTLNDLPIKYQEVEIWNDTDKLFFGYVSNFTFPTFTTKEQVVKLEIELLSPYAMTVNRITTITGNYGLNSSMSIIFAKLINDGYEIVENDLSEVSVSMKYISQTVEYIMNDLSNKNKFYWYIDINKGIHIKLITKLLETVLTLDSNCEYSISELTPKIQAVDYANNLHIKNARVYFIAYDDVENPDLALFLPHTTSVNETVKLQNPFDIGDVSKRMLFEDPTIYVLRIATLTDINYATITYSRITGLFTYSTRIGFTNQDEDDATKTVLLERDNFYKNLIVGIKFKESVIITQNYSYTALRYNTLNFIDIGEINLNKDKISPSGVIEKTIDVKGKWFILNELIEFAKSKVSLNNIQTNEVNITFKDVFPNLEIGNIIKVNLPDYFVQDNFIITDMSKKFDAKKVQEMSISCRNSNIIENFSDFYRRDIEEENTEQLAVEIISPYSEYDIVENVEYIAKGVVISDS